MRFPIFVVWLKESLTKMEGCFFFTDYLNHHLKFFIFFCEESLDFLQIPQPSREFLSTWPGFFPASVPKMCFFSHMWNFLQQNPLGKTQKTWGSVALWHVHVWKRRETTIIYDTTWLDYILNCRLEGFQLWEFYTDFFSGEAGFHLYNLEDFV